MSSTTLYRLSGIGLFIGSLITIISFIPDFIPASTLAGPSTLLRAIGLTLFVLGLPAMYARLAPRAGILGLVGFIAVFAAILVGIALQPIFGIILPFLATHAPALAKGGPPHELFLLFAIQSVLSLIGDTLLGIAVMRAIVFPRWAGLVLIVSSVVGFVGGLFFGVDFGNACFMIGLAGYAWLAVGMVSKRPTTLQAELSTSGVRA